MEIYQFIMVTFQMYIMNLVMFLTSNSENYYQIR